MSLKARSVLALRGKYNIPEPDTEGKVEKRNVRKTPEGHFYDGEWNTKTGVRQGKGVMVWSDGSIYEG